MTGGIGGVHRDVNETMDVSADIIELAKCPIMVVSSGIKSILDIGRTMELLVFSILFPPTYSTLNSI